MVVWKMTDSAGKAKFFAQKSEAKAALREYRSTTDDKKAGSGPEQVKVTGREELANLLNSVAAS